MVIDKNFPVRLKQLRVQKGLSQTELGELAKIDYTHIGKYERGESNPSLETLVLISDALNVTLDYLVKGNQDDAAVAKLEDRDLLKMFEEIEKFSADEKSHIKYFLDSAIKNKKLQQLANASQPPSPPPLSIGQKNL